MQSSGPEETDRVAPAGPLRGSGNLTGPAQSGMQSRAKVLRYRYGLGARQEISASISAFTSRHDLPASRS